MQSETILSDQPKGQVDVLFLYKEEEFKYVERIVNILEERGYTTFFWRKDVQFGQKIEEGEEYHMHLARKIIVCLGTLGWGPNHLRLVKLAQDAKKEIIPVLIGEPQADAYLEADRLFADFRYVNLTSLSEQFIRDLLKAIGLPGKQDDHVSKFDQVFITLMDGNDEQRSEVLKQISSMGEVDKESIAVRLRNDITTKFRHGIANELGRNVRPLDKMISIRSWMLSALICTGAERKENKEMLLEHLMSDIEPDVTIQYWLLAGLYREKVTYLQAAIDQLKFQESPGSLMMMFVLAIQSSENIESHFAECLQQDEFLPRWKVLRILRIVPMPRLAKSVVRLIRELMPAQPLAYDALNALTNPEMAKAAVPYITELITINGFVDRLIGVVNFSDAGTMYRLAWVLFVLPDIEVDQALNAARSNNEFRLSANGLKRILRNYRTRKVSPVSAIAGYASDSIDPKKDYLNITNDVKNLSAVMLAKDINPPLAIGLFGKWGSGKSFFMHALREEVKTVKKIYNEDPLSPFHTKIVEVEFNAWHYLDTNLLASLAHNIFKTLAGFVIPHMSEKEQVENLQKQIDNKKKEQQDIEDLKQIQISQLEEKETELKRLEHQRLTRIVELKEINLNDIEEMLDKEQNEKLAQSIKEIGLPATRKSIHDLDNILQDAKTVRGTINNLFLSVINSPNRTVIIVLLVLLLVGIPMLGWVLKDWLTHALAAVTAFLAGITTVVSGIAVILKNGLNKVKAGIKTIEASKKSVEEVIERKKEVATERENELKVDIDTLQKDIAEKKRTIEQANSGIVALEEKLRSFYEERSLSTFLKDRCGSVDYLKHLGIISTIREDFRLLQEKMNSKATIPHLEYKQVDRIILYIDDLDRCPPNKVLEVLQAVHLLLAYPLFVVVVGVDPKWLIRSLEASYLTFEKENNGKVNSELFMGTPHDFLEKIFQVPFGLEPMNEEGFNIMMNALLSPEISTNQQIQEPQETRQATNPNSPGSDSQGNNRPDAGIQNIIGSGNVSDANTQIDTLAGKQTKVDKEEEYELIEEALRIKEWETKFAAELFPFITSPRSAKRFTNIYRLLKAGVPAEELSTFEGTAEIAGEFQLPMFLLALLIGFPAQCGEIFTIFLINAEQQKNIAKAFERKTLIRLLDEKSERLAPHINQIISVQSFPGNAEVVKKWVPKVARFSYDFFTFNAKMQYKTLEGGGSNLYDMKSSM
ncbi:hypothetical protein A3860_11250 [Niastella vici]|uniref:TIR domain-containing protein n=1 Tax=Niastella vici TaxID=1703345 RepID=A0A1V9FFI7_9BACT|nr:P-loop NTPase fold protein [Niastella vici]OQP57132.1 hypothetical protein A3860_11250 [Niastella vici]